MKKILESRIKNELLLISSLILVYFSIQFGFLILLAFVPVFLAVRGISLKKSMIYGAAYGFLFVLELFYWVINSKNGLVTLLVSCLLCSLVFMIFFAISNFLIRRYENYSFVLIPLSFLILKEISSWAFFHSNYINLALVQPFGSALIGSVGEAGVNYLIILFGLALSNINKRTKESIVLILLIFALVLSSSICFNCGGQDNEIKFALIQGNFPASWEWRISNYDKIYERYENLTLEAAKLNPDFIIWPEYAIPHDIIKDKVLYEKISKLANYTKSNLVVGTLTFIEENKTGFYDKRTDTALVFNRNGELISRYDSVLPYPTDFSVIPGQERKLIETDKGNFYIYMCYEEIIPTKFEEEPDFLVSIVNNQDFKGKRNLRMMSLYSRIRAAENAKYLARASNNGVTQIIDPKGKVLRKIGSNQEGPLIYTVRT